MGRWSYGFSSPFHFKNKSEKITLLSILCFVCQCLEVDIFYLSRNQLAQQPSQLLRDRCVVIHLLFVHYRTCPDDKKHNALLRSVCPSSKKKWIWRWRHRWSRYRLQPKSYKIAHWIQPSRAITETQNGESIFVINNKGATTSESRAMQLQGDMQCTQSGILIRLFGLSFPFKSDV